MGKNYLQKTAKSKTVFFSFVLLFVFLLFGFAVRAQVFYFSNVYSGSQEAAPNASPGTGIISGTYDAATNTISYTIFFRGLLAPATAAHFHAPAPPGVNAAIIMNHVNFPNITSGTYTRTDVFTDQQETWLLSGLVYSNIHTSVFPGGEIRAQITPTLLPANVYPFTNVYSGSQEVPPNNSPGIGIITGTYNDATNTLSYTIMFSGLIGNTMPVAGNPAHLHAPAPPGVNAGITLQHVGFPAGVTAGTFTKTDVLSEQQEAWLKAGLIYSNIHTTALPGGEIRAQLFLGPPFTRPVINCPANITVSNAPNQCSQSVSFAATATGNPEPTITYRIGNTVITSPHVFPVGTTTVTATALSSGGAATCSFTVTVNDAQGPTISNVSASPNRLWPPNHKMVLVTVNYTSTDNCPGATTCGLSVSSNEPVNGEGDGNTAPDWEVVDDHHVYLRAERSGKGDGRIYTITVTCRDQAGNESQSSTTVTVPHDKGKKGEANLGLTQEVSFLPNEKLSVNVLPNPSRDYFNLRIQSSNAVSGIQLRVYDLTGRVVESRNNVAAEQYVKIGTGLKPGVYVVELRQGSERKQMKLVKTQ